MRTIARTATTHLLPEGVKEAVRYEGCAVAVVQRIEQSVDLAGDADLVPCDARGVGTSQFCLEAVREPSGRK